ncbi:MAG: hypothetical protein EAZ51_08695 [Sphingobacteriales bacterium]|nr:MAG: hypothetical protein EAZ64_00910 [Sphingobacteriales bacterium]TAF78871.1 MAG: hypothetical protein EAZ51_08695 [Sphingobacteriales bacterium]
MLLFNCNIFFKHFNKIKIFAFYFILDISKIYKRNINYWCKRFKIYLKKVNVFIIFGIVIKIKTVN